MGYLQSQNIFPHLIHHKGEKRNFTVENPGRQHLTQLIKINVTGSQTNPHHMPSDMTPHNEYSIFSGVLLPNMQNINHEERADTLNWETYHKIIDL